MWTIVSATTNIWEIVSSAWKHSTPALSFLDSRKKNYYKSELTDQAEVWTWNALCSKNCLSSKSTQYDDHNTKRTFHQWFLIYRINPHIGIWYFEKASWLKEGNVFLKKLVDSKKETSYVFGVCSNKLGVSISLVCTWDWESQSLRPALHSWALPAPLRYESLRWSPRFDSHHQSWFSVSRYLSERVYG